MGTYPWAPLLRWAHYVTLFMKVVEPSSFSSVPTLIYLSRERPKYANYMQMSYCTPVQCCHLGLVTRTNTVLSIGHNESHSMASLGLPTDMMSSGLRYRQIVSSQFGISHRPCPHVYGSLLPDGHTTIISRKRCTGPCTWESEKNTVISNHANCCPSFV